LAKHRDSSKWFKRARNIKLEVFSTREDALSAEAAAIKYESPLFNRSSSQGPAHKIKQGTPRWGALRQEVLDCMKTTDQLAKDYGVSRNTLARYMREMGLNRRDLLREKRGEA